MSINVNNSEISYDNEEIIETKSVSKKSIYKVLKRIIDIFGGIIGVIVFIPIYLIIGTIIKIDSKGPILFKHERIGKNGNKIYIYKFRTMKLNAQDMIKDFTEEQMKEWKENFKLTNDPRVTKVGRILRKTSLDEVPQILNILKGDLSIVGPRPVIDEEIEKYGDNKDKFLSVTPGLTGYWQANGRSNTTYEERIKMELYYIDNMSLVMDIGIIFKTVVTVIRKEGAV